MTQRKDITPIETIYRGYRFRSRLEARWAVFFDAMNTPWQYELEGFDLPSGRRYLPDFFLPRVGLRETTQDIGVWIEIKPDYPTGRELELIREFGGLNEPLGPDGLPAYLEQQPNERNVVLLVGDPSVQSQLADGHHQMGPWWDNGMVWMKCRQCHRLKIEFLESSYTDCRCGGFTDWNHPDLLSAERAARSMRFGESRRG